MVALTNLGAIPGDFRQPTSLPASRQGRQQIHTFVQAQGLFGGDRRAPLQTGTARPLLEKLPRTSICHCGKFCMPPCPALSAPCFVVPVDRKVLVGISAPARPRVTRWGCRAAR